MQDSQAELFARSFQSQVARNPGAACLTLPVLRALGVKEAVNGLCASEHVVAHGQIIELMVLNRLQAPKPLYKVQDWLARTALESALGVQAEQAHDTRLGETLDAVYQQYQAIWQKVVLAAVRHYHLPLDWLHYDITSTYFEGAYSESELIKFGYSRDQRPDSKQLNIGLTTLRHGLPLAFQVLVGNTADATTPRQNMEAVRKLLAETQAAHLTVVHDRGMATAETLLWYTQHQQRFISPVTADNDLQAVIDAVPVSALLAEPLDYQPQRAGDAGPPSYHGVWREYTLTHDGQSVRLALAGGPECRQGPSGRREASNAAGAAAETFGRDPGPTEPAQVQAPGLHPGTDSSGPAWQRRPGFARHPPGRCGRRACAHLPSQCRKSSPWPSSGMVAIRF